MLRSRSEQKTTLLVDARGTLRPMLRLALPVLAEQMLAMLVLFSDSVLTGKYFDEEHLAAVSLLTYLLWMLSCLFVVVGIGATAMVARFVGGRDVPSANHVANQAFLVGCGIALVGTLAGLGLTEQLVSLMQLKGESAELAVRYLDFVLPVLPALMLSNVGFACLRGAGDMVSPLVIMAVVNLVNISLSWSLSQGLGPMPKLGWDGIAIGTACGYLVGGLLVIWLFLRGRYGLRLRRSLLVPNAALIRRLLRIGLPGGGDMTAVILCQLWFVAIIYQLGDLAAAAHGVAIRIESLAFLPATAFQVAASTLAGQYLGAGNPRKAQRSVWMAVMVGGGVVSAAGVLFYVAAEPLTLLIVRADDAQVVSTAAPLLRMVAVAMPPFALATILSGALRGAGDTRWPLFFTMVGYLGVRIPLTYLLAHHWGYGVKGAWMAMVADVCVRCLLVVWRFWHGGWKRVVV